MNDERKTKAQLIEELAELRKTLSDSGHVDPQRRKPEGLLHETEESLSVFFDSATDGFVIFDAGFNLVEINPASLRLFPEGTTREDLLGKNITQIQPGLEKTDRALGDSEHKYRTLVETMSDGVAVQDKDGRTIHTRISSSPIQDSDGNLQGSLGVITEITEGKRSLGRVERLNSVLRAIRDVNQLIVAEKDRDALIRRACEILVEARGYQHAWAALTNESRIATLSAEAGLGEGFAPLKRQMDAGDLPVCFQRALDLGEVVVTDDPPSSCDDCPLTGSHTGATLGVTVRLEHGGKLFGAIGLAVPTEYAKDPDEISLVRELAGDLGFALHGLQVEEEQRRTDETLRKSERMLKEAQRVARMGFLSWDLTAGEMEWSEETSRMYGFDPEEFAPTIELTVDLVHPDDREFVQERMNAALAGTKEYNIEHRVVRPDDRVIWVQATAEIARNAEGEPVHMFGTVVDITERKKAVEDLRQREEWLAVTLRSIGDGVIATDEKGCVTFLNPTAEELTGWSQEEAAGRHLDEVFDIRNEDTGERVESPVEKVLREGGVVGLANHTKLIRRDGTELPIADSGAPIGDDRAEISGVVLVFSDQTAERTAQRALRDSEMLNRTLVEHLPQRIFLKDQDLVYLSCNASYAQDQGTTTEEIVGKDDFAFHPPELAEGYRADDRAVMASGTPKDIEEQYVLAGEERWAHTIKVPFRDEQGRVVGVLGIFEDITERKRAEMRLRQSESSLKEAQKIAHAGSWDLDIATGNLTWSDESYRIYGFEPQEFGPTYERFLTILHPEDHERVQKHVDAALSGDAEYDIDFRFVRPDGETGWVHCDGVVTRDAAGTPLRFRGTQIDITERYQAEEERKRILDLSNDLICVAGMDGYFKYVNPAWRETLGYSEQDLLSMPFLEVIHPDDHPANDAAVETLSAGKALDAFENRYIHKDGSIRVISWKATPLPEKGHIYCVGRDVTEERKHRDHLEELVVARTADLVALNKDQEAFAYSVSHDLRAPLRAIDGFSKVLLDDYQDKLDDTGKDLINRVRAGTLRMSRLIDDLLNLSRLTRAEMYLQRLDLGELARKIAGELQRDEPGRLVVFDIASRIPARGDRALLEAALDNLLGNSWKFTGHREHPRIELGVTEQDGERVYYVRDDGAGFDMAYADKLFGAFQRLHDTAEFPGSGIGLAIVNRVIQRHGGRIWAEGEVDKGATFYFTLPGAPRKQDKGV